jgi:hypothetical protein
MVVLCTQKADNNGLNVDNNSDVKNFVRVLKEFPIDKRWQDLILETFQNQVASLTNANQIPDVLERWNWFRFVSEVTWDAITWLHRRGAGSAMDIANLKWLTNDSTMPENEIKPTADRFRRVYQHLEISGIIKGIKLSKKQVGRGKREVTIWVSPFALPWDVENATQSYLNRGGALATNDDVPKKKTEEDYRKSAKKEVRYRNIVREEYILDKTRKKKDNILNYPYKCPECEILFKANRNADDVCGDCLDKGLVRNLVKRTPT